MLFTEEEQGVGVGGVTVQDMWIAIQLLDKAAARGIIQPTEYEVLSSWRGNVTTSIQRAIGKDFDEETLKYQQAQAQAQAAQQQAALEAQQQAASANQPTEAEAPKPARKSRKAPAKKAS